MLAFLLPSSRDSSVPVQLTCCCSKLCSAVVCCDHSIPKFVLELSVENHISRPRARLNKAHTMISHEVTLRKVRFLDMMAPGMEMKKVKKTKTALARAARDKSQLQKLTIHGSQHVEGSFTCQGRVLYKEPRSYVSLHSYAASHTRHVDNSNREHQSSSKEEDDIDSEEGEEDLVIHHVGGRFQLAVEAYQRARNKIDETTGVELE